ncbi:MAG: DNA polymerase III subunit alpha, partial [Planctomycetes bacterium]|nr:DNA polymerase III subunit alpha [Planctomycetota bacterium]
MHDPAAGYDYVELHAHSCWSLREGASSTDELVDRAIALGYPALALTDHDNVYGAMEFARAAQERGLRPITGVELTVLGDDGQQSHITVLAAEVDGFRNICRILSLAYRTHGKDSPLVEKRWLAEHHAGLIVLSGCRESELSRLLDPNSPARDRGRAERIAREYQAIFGDRFYIELQDHDVYGDRERIPAMAELADRLGIEIVAANNAHYHVRERHRLNDVLVAVRHRRTLDSSHELRRPNSEFFLKSGQAMARRFANYPAAIRNTLVIAERCQFDLSRDLPYRLPDYQGLPEGSTMDGFLRGICERAFRRKYNIFEPGIYADARARLDRELELIERHGLAGFFLVYWEILQMVNEIAHELRGRPRNLAPDERPVGRGRGSSVSSIVCYLIGLSHIDPVTNKLYLDRFLNDELHSLPDIDIDFPRDIRDELLQRVYDRFGEDHAALVCSFPTYQFKSAVLDIGKTLGLPAPVLAKLNKL